MSTPDEEEPTTFGKYELLERIGSGGMAEVHRARMTGAHGFEKVVVVKKILPAYASNPAFVKMLVAEAKISSMLHHPNIVQTHELGEHEGQYYIAMEHVAGVDWLEVLTRSAGRGIRPPTEVVVYVMSEVLKGLHHAHRATDAAGRFLNLVHRDVSPSNILLSYEGEVKIMDFGVARVDLEGEASSERSEKARADGRTRVLGKLSYQSPELVARMGIDHRSDLFAVGVVLFESLTLKRLFTGDSDLEILSQIRDVDVEEHLEAFPSLPDPLKVILRRSLARHPGDRYESAEDFYGGLLDYLFAIQVRVSSSDVARALAEILEIDEDAPAAPLSPNSEPRKPITRPSTRPTRARGHGGRTLQSTRPMGKGSSPEELLEAPSAEHTPVLGLATTKRSALPDEAGTTPPEESLLYEGTLEAFGVPTFLYRLAVRGATGRLVLRGSSVHKEVAFRGGVPVHVQSSAPAELFGELLIARDLLDRERLHRAIDVAREAERPLGEVLVSEGVIPAHELLRLLEEQFRTRYLEIFCWQDGDYSFFGGEPDLTNTLWMGTDPYELIAEGVRTHMSSKRLGEVYSPLMDLALSHLENPHITHNNLRLSSRELRCYGRLSKSQTLAQALESCDEEDRPSLLLVVFLLEQTELLAFTAPSS